jgi:hypothetical protein
VQKFASISTNLCSTHSARINNSDCSNLSRLPSSRLQFIHTRVLRSAPPVENNKREEKRDLICATCKLYPAREEKKPTPENGKMRFSLSQRAE